MPDETREKREEIAARLAETMAREGMSRALYARVTVGEDITDRLDDLAHPGHLDGSKNLGS